MEDIQAVVTNQNILFKRDAELQKPMMERWGIPLEHMFDER